MAMAAKMVLAFLESQGMKGTLLKEDLLRAGWNFEGGSIDIYLKFDETDTHVHLEGLNFINVPKDREEKMYKVINQMNDDYNFIKFVLDVENGQVNARDDAIIQLDSCGEECVELILRMVKVVEAAFPNFMKALWA